MPNQDLLDYIKKETSLGVSRETIQAALVNSGWSTQDISVAWNSIEQTYSDLLVPINNLESQMVPVSKEIERVSLKWLIISIVIGWAIYFPAAWFVLAYSGFIFDSGSSEEKYLLFIVINSIPFVYMVILTVYTIIKRNKFFCIWMALAIPIGGAFFQLLMSLIFPFSRIFYLKTMEFDANSLQPSCVITTNKREYKLGEVIELSWTSKNAERLHWGESEGFSRRVQPSGIPEANGAQSLSVTSPGDKVVVLEVWNAEQYAGICSEVFTITP
jgi:hypothetical protein